jgi:GT2 family glycosyltransferase
MTSPALTESSRMPVLIITGMHRSGTSLTASLLQSAGLFIGERLMPASPGNEAGHFEDMEFYEFHRRALRATGHADDGLVKTTQIDLPKPLEREARQLIVARESGGRPWGWKDPRTVLFLDHWHRLLPHSFNLFVFRAPWEVVDSLYRRSDEVFGINPRLALDAWYHYNVLVRDFVKRHSDSSLIYELPQVITDATGVVASIRRRCGIPLENPQSLYREGMLDRQPDSHHIAVIREVAPKCAALYSELQALAGVEPRWQGPSLETVANAEDDLCSGILTDWYQVRRQQVTLAQMQAEKLRLHEAQIAADRDKIAMGESRQALAAESERRIRELEASLAEVTQATERQRSVIVESHHAYVAELEHRTQELQSKLVETRQVAERERGAVAEAHQVHVAELESHVSELQAILVEACQASEREREAIADSHRAQVAELEHRIRQLETSVVSTQQATARGRVSIEGAHQAHFAEHERLIADLQAALMEAERNAAMRAERDLADVVEVEQWAGDWERKSEKQKEESEGLQRKLLELTRQHQTVLASNSWRLTRPLRALRRLGVSRPCEYLRAKASSDAPPRHRSSERPEATQVSEWRNIAQVLHKKTWRFLNLGRHGEQVAAIAAKGLRRLYECMPISMENRLKHRRFLARRFPRILHASGSPAVTIPGFLSPSPPAAVGSTRLSLARQVPSGDAAHRRASAWEMIALPRSESPVVSIIIPVHNQWQHTYACLQSIVQAEPDLAYEVIIADDVSTDETMRITSWVSGAIVSRNATNLGFLRNCNVAATKARGDYILFLNNDTEIQAAAITKLLGVFRRHPDAGLVGSKLIYPDGRLQEAGGIVWADGSAWNYGRGQNPSLPEFNYLRETDYCSGAAIMVPRSLLQQLGGFDERYAPAYNEDSDLAFAIRSVGRKVYYQPASVVVHHEGASHGTDVAQGVKSRQAVNQQHFYEKWHSTLSRDHFPNGLNVFHARDRSADRKTMLVIDHYVPQPDRDAGSRTMWCFLRLFQEMGMNVKFWPHNLYYDKDYTPALEQHGIEVFHGAAYLDQFDAWIRENGTHLDYVLLSRPHVANDFVTAIRRFSGAKLLYYGHDLHHARMLNEFQVTGDTSLEKRARATRELEESIWQQVDAVYYPSPEETSVVAQACPHGVARTVPPYFFDEQCVPTPGPAGRKGILFVAGFGHPPNVDAAEWLVRDIMPLVRREIPDAHLLLVGSNPTPAVQQLASESVTVTGYVSDDALSEFYRTARVAIVPLRFGAGVKSKVIEAMHNGIPLVTTPTGAQGVAGLELLIPVSDEPTRLAEEIALLIRDDDHWSAVAASGSQYVSARFSRAAMHSAFAHDIDVRKPATIAAPAQPSRNGST